MQALPREQLLRHHLDPDLHGRAKHAIHRGAQNDQFADVHRMQEVQAVHRRGHDGLVRVPHARHGGRQIHQVHHLAAQHVAEAVGVVGQGQFQILRGRFAYRFAFHQDSSLRRR